MGTTGQRGPDPVMDVLDDKVMAKHDEHEEQVKVKGDYSGAVGKTDPMEKKLVKKLDIWIMVSAPRMAMHAAASLGNGN